MILWQIMSGYFSLYSFSLFLTYNYCRVYKYQSSFHNFSNLPINRSAIIFPLAYFICFSFCLFSSLSSLCLLSLYIISTALSLSDIFSQLRGVSHVAYSTFLHSVFAIPSLQLRSFSALSPFVLRSKSRLKLDCGRTGNGKGMEEKRSQNEGGAKPERRMNGH